MRNELWRRRPWASGTGWQNLHLTVTKTKEMSPINLPQIRDPSPLKAPHSLSLSFLLTVKSSMNLIATQHIFGGLLLVKEVGIYWLPRRCQMPFLRSILMAASEVGFFAVRIILRLP